jgi:hypothetical protein
MEDRAQCPALEATAQCPLMLGREGLRRCEDLLQREPRRPLLDVNPRRLARVARQADTHEDGDLHEDHQGDQELDSRPSVLGLW